MWRREYKDYPPDSTLKKYPIEPSNGIVGCEMHELNGWGNKIHIPKQKKRTGLLNAIVGWLFPKSEETKK